MAVSSENKNSNEGRKAPARLGIEFSPELMLPRALIDAVAEGPA